MQKPGDETLSLKVGHAIVRRRRVIIALFALATVVCALMTQLVKVNYNTTDYLPKDSPSTVALDEMSAAFDSGIPNVRVYAEGIDQAHAEQLAGDFADVDRVSEVMWLGSQADLKQPEAVLDQDLVNDWKTDTGYLYELTVSDDATKADLDAIREKVTEAGGTASLSGTLVDTISTQESTTREVSLIMAASVGIVVLVLLLTSHSWAEPILFIVAIGVAIVLNMGTNLVLGQISLVSQICGSVLQLAVSMDYAIVFLHRFRTVQRSHEDNLEAMAHTISESLSVVLSSAAVTFFGFLALMVMRFGIGPDLAVVLAKGIAFSFLSVMLLMPCLTLALLPLLDRLDHRYLVPSLEPLARLLTRMAAPVAVIIALAAVPAFLGQNRADFFYGTGDSTAPDSEPAREKARVEDAFGSSETWVLMVPENTVADQKRLESELAALDHVDGVTSYVSVAGVATPTQIVPEETLKQVVSGGWSRIVITTDIQGEGAEAFSLVEKVRDAAAGIYGDSYRLAGNSVSLYDLKEVTGQDSTPVKLFTVGSIGIVLLLMFRSVSIPFLIILPIEISIWMNLTIPYLTGTSLSYIGYLIIEAVQMGAAVDYAIILAREYFDRRRSMGAKDASREAIAHAGVPILTSASILVLAGLAIQLISTNGMVSQLGTLIFRGALIAALMMFLFLPFLLRLFDGVIKRTSIGLNTWEPGTTPHAGTEGRRPDADATPDATH